MVHKIALTILCCMGLSLFCNAQQWINQDSLVVAKNTALITAKPTKSNYKKYYSTAASLFELDRFEEAKTMFHNIEKSTGWYYSATYKHASDAGDDGNIYGYGSYTSNYKNSASLYLTKIYIEEANYTEALKYLGKADTIYPVYFTCGTGSNMYAETLRDLYATCYVHLNKPDETIRLLLPYSFKSGVSDLITALKSKYTAAELKSYMDTALKSITCVVNEYVSTTTQTTYKDGKIAEVTEQHYTGGSGTIKLFGTVVDFPYPNLKDGETLTRQHFVDYFLSSHLYMELSGDYSHKDMSSFMQSIWGW